MRIKWHCMFKGWYSSWHSNRWSTDDSLLLLLSSRSNLQDTPRLLEEITKDWNPLQHERNPSLPKGEVILEMVEWIGAVPCWEDQTEEGSWSPTSNIWRAVMWRRPWTCWGGRTLNANWSSAKAQPQEELNFLAFLSLFWPCLSLESLQGSKGNSVTKLRASWGTS